MGHKLTGKELMPNNKKPGSKRNRSGINDSISNKSVDGKGVVKEDIQKEEEIVRSDQELTERQAPSPKPNQPQAQAEKGVSGHMPDPESDKNALDSAKKVGLYVETNEGETVEDLNIAKQVDLAEEERRGV